MEKIINIRVKPYNQKELAYLYEVSSRTVKNWIKPFKHEIGQKIGNTFTAKQVEIIFDRLGFPYDIAA